MEVIAIINQKGGVGKSTTAMALGCGLARRGERVLFVDMDPQGNMSSTLKAKAEGPSVYEVLRQEASVQEAIEEKEEWDLLASSPSLAGADTVITEVGKEYRLREALEPIKRGYHTIILDTPPSLSILTVNALTAANSVIIPAQADIYSLQGIHQLENTLDTVRRYCNPDLSIRGILLTRYNSRAILSRDLAEMTEQVARRLRTEMFKTTIREAIAVKEAQASTQDIFSYAPKSNAVADYQAFINEYLERREKNGDKEKL